MSVTCVGDGEARVCTHMLCTSRHRGLCRGDVRERACASTKHHQRSAAAARVTSNPAARLRVAPLSQALSFRLVPVG